MCVCKGRRGEGLEKRRTPPWPDFDWLGCVRLQGGWKISPNLKNANKDFAEGTPAHDHQVRLKARL